MTAKTDTTLLKEEQQAKIRELNIQQEKLKELQAELEKLSTKINNHEPISAEDTQFIGNLGWLTAAAVSIAALAASVS
jgi:uncharacterized protein YlxW (UPF0749 family)